MEKRTRRECKNEFDEKRACKSCINDRYIYDSLKKYREISECSYCQQRRKTISVKEIVGEIEDGINTEYKQCGMEHYSPDNDNYVVSTAELEWILYGEYSCRNDLFEDICSYIPKNGWCERDNEYIGDKEDISAVYNKEWKTFCHMVKYETRYVFFNQWDEGEEDERAKNILEFISKAVKELELIKEVLPSIGFCRGRTHRTKEGAFSNDKQLAAPPIGFAKANRMSAEGISIFYGANNIKTVLAEIYDGTEPYATIGQFKCKDKLCLLDLSRVLHMKSPSLFDRKNRHKRRYIGFFKEFVNMLISPVDNIPAIEYVPTQILAEYFRHVYNYGCMFDGIIYPSAKNPHGKCYALFFNNEQCINGENQRLIMDKDTVRTYRMLNNIQYEEV